MRELRCAYLTMKNPGDFVTDYDLGIAPMAELAWQVELVNWRDRSIEWNRFDAVYICTPWDYLEDPDLFLDVLQTIEDSGAILVNELTLVHWTLEKSYLKDLEFRGADIVPSVIYENYTVAEIDNCFADFDVDKLVIKPLIGANAIDTFVVGYPVNEELSHKLVDAFRDRPFIVQPFIGNIEAEGEFSLFFLGGVHSHTIQKIPKRGDFRVQEEHGADIRAVTASDELVATATRVMAMVAPEPVYARIDLVRGDDDRYLLMELELIEPSLYLRTDAGAAKRFAAAFDNHVRGATRQRVS